MPDYVELHAHSNFSLLDGASHPEDLVARAAALGMDALALTDHDAVYGAMRFVDAARAAVCRRAGVQSGKMAYATVRLTVMFGEKETAMSRVVLVLVVALLLVLPGAVSAQEDDMPELYAVAWSPDGSRIAVARSGGVVQVLDATTLQVLATIQHPQVSVLAWSPDGARLASGGWDDTIRIWDPDTGQSLAMIDSLVDRVTSIKWSSDGSYLIASGFEAGYRIWNASTYEFMNSFMGGSYQTDLSPDNTRLAVAGWGGVGIVNVETGEVIALLEGHQREVMSVAWSPDGTKLVSGGYDRTVRLWDATTHQQLMVLQAPEGDVSHVAWSPDGSLIVGGGTKLYVWDASTGMHLETISTGSGGFAWNPDGTQIVYSTTYNELDLIPVPRSSGCASTAPADPPTHTVAAGDVAGLIAAIDASNANLDPDIIALGEGTYTLTAAHSGWYGQNGLPMVTTMTELLD